MIIVQPYAKLLAFTEDGERRDFTLADGVGLLRRIEWFARKSHQSEDRMSAVSWERFVQFVVMEKGDWSVVEHATVSVDMLVDRGITHEVVRHRLFSYTQESTRFVNYEKKMPPRFVEPLGLDERQRGAWSLGIEQAEEQYKEMLHAGCAPQIARSVFPNALASNIGITGNLRNWRHFLIMRTTKEAHPQIREVCIPLLDEFKKKIPLLFDDIEPLRSQAEGIARGR